MAAPAPPATYHNAFGYFASLAKPAIKAQHPTWKAPTISNALTYIWNNDRNVRRIYTTFFATDPRPALPALPAGVIPNTRKSKADALKAKVAYNRNPTILNPPAPAPQDPQDADQYPYSFWPDRPWPDDPYDREGGRLMETERTQQDSTTDEHRRQWMLAGLQQEGVQEGPWNGEQYLGHGAYGATGLWVERDAAGRVTDRVVVKECRPVGDSWRSPKYWRKKKPREILIHELVDSTRTYATHRNLIRHRASRLMMTQRRYRLYLEFCNGGTLWQAMENRIRTIYRVIPSNSWATEEQWIWVVFASLVDACLALQRGNTPVGQDVDPEWKPITHLDISAGNIFLHYEDATSYPRVVLSDFGMSFYDLNPTELRPTYSENPSEYKFHFPPRVERYPPEMQYDAIPPLRLTAKADVWAIGSIVWMLLTHWYFADGPKEGVWGETWDDIVNAPAICRPGSDTASILRKTNYNALRWFTDELKDLVRGCLDYNPDNRPSLEDLHTRITRFMNGSVTLGGKTAGFLQDRPRLGLATDGTAFSHFEVGQMKRQRPT